MSTSSTSFRAFVTETGTVHHEGARPSPQRHRGSPATVYTTGALCAACLVGTWPSTHLRQHQHVCDDCRWLHARVFERCGLVPRLRWTDDRTVESSRAVRAGRLASVFEVARGRGSALTEARGARWGSRPAGSEPRPRALAWEDFAELVGTHEVARVGRFAEWLVEVDPDGETLGPVVRETVEVLAGELREHRRDAQVARARVVLADALADAKHAVEVVHEAVDGVLAAERAS